MSECRVRAMRPQDRYEVAELICRYPYRMKRRTDKNLGRSEGEIDILLLDTMGELTGVIASSDVTFLGGSLVPGIGGHNVLEAAAQNKPVLFGPHMENFPDISRELMETGGGFMVRDAWEIARRAIQFLTDTEAREDAGRCAMEVVENNRGAARRTLKAIEPLMGEG